MLKLKFYGLGGQGIVTAAKVLSEAVSLFEDKYAITVPAYGHERRGAPVNTSIILDEEPILLNSFVYDPDIVLVMDESITDKGVNIAEGIKPESILVLNSNREEVISRYQGYGFSTIYHADATGVALETIGFSIPNGSMLGVLAKTGIVSIESVEKALKDTFGEKAGEKNARAAREAYDRTEKV